MFELNSNLRNKLVINMNRYFSTVISFKLKVLANPRYEQILVSHWKRFNVMSWFRYFVCLFVGIVCWARISRQYGHCFPVQMQLIKDHPLLVSLLIIVGLVLYCMVLSFLVFSVLLVGISVAVISTINVALVVRKYVTQ